MIDDDTSLALNFLNKDRQKIPKDYSKKSLIKKYYSSMKERVKTKSYKKKGIKVLISFEEFEMFWNQNLELMNKIQDAGYVVSVDRINSFDHYRIDNIRILPLHLNRMLGKLELLQSEMKRIYSKLDELKDWV